MEILHEKTALSRYVQGLRAQGKRIALVPTMGALHAGHASLIQHARDLADDVIVSVFVNPTQFGPNEDFARYPRTFEADCALAGHAGATAMYAPDAAQMYPDGFATTIHPPYTEILCGAFRPGHFAGVATVVVKLLQQVQPDIALFGEKDYQQLCVIRAVVRDLDIPVEIQSVPTLREADGLAMSSRNRYLTQEQRENATELFKQLTALKSALSQGLALQEALENARQALKMVGFRVEYLELRQENDLAPLTAFAPQSRLLVAAWLGTTRLIDNIAL